MPRTTRATRAVIDRKAEDQGSDGYSDVDCDSVVEPRASSGAATAHARDSTEAAEEMRAQGGAALEHTLSGALTGAPATALNTEQLLCSMMESFAKMQAETNRTLVETLRSLHHGNQWNPVASTPAASPTANARAISGGNFSKCTARFDGQSRDTEVLEAFIDAVEVYKECADVTDDHALRGLSMLLSGDAAVWWRGARACVGTWPDALARLRATYGVQKPAYRILREVFTCEQSECERAEVFISKVLACLALDFLLIGLGLSISFVTMVLPEVLNAKEGLSITKKQASWFGSMAYLCQPLGSIFSGPLLDHFGRKKALFLVNIPHVVAWLLMYYAWDVPSLFIGNALLGIGTGVMEAPSVTYIGEISDPSIRGTLTTLTNGFTSTGIFVAYLLGTVLPWRQAALLALTVPLATMVLVLFVPETPIWLLSKGRQKEALSSLCRLRGWARPEDVKEEFDELLQYHETLNRCVLCAKEGKIVEPCEHHSINSIKQIILKIKHVFFVKETMKPFLLVVSYFFFYTMSGALPVRPNMVNVCKALGMKYDPKTIVVVIGALLIVMSMLSAILVKTIGKRKLVIGSMLGTACCSIAISIYARTSLPSTVFSYEMETFTDMKETLPVVLFLLLICFNSLGIPWVLLSEVFPFRSRGIATALAAASNYIINFGAAKTNYNIEYAFHLSGTFGLYAIFGFIGTVYLYLFLPETENKTLAEIEAFYKSDRKIFADDFVINAFRKKKLMNGDANKPMLVKSIN